ncbi:AAA family ATPase [Methylobacterium nodulans]|uniref:AAA family ATPase n=1 Tax=Methylobacterium nodulans TaxID=114616 RepID=UPI0012ECC1BE|nr:ATP-binding protein [Methylobacterium nodulans]
MDCRGEIYVECGTIWSRTSVSEIQNQWYVITGPPCCGKSTTIELLSRRGFWVRPEVAREYIDREMRKGREIQEIRASMQNFQVDILMNSLETEQYLPKEKIIFFDRGVPDSLAYFRLHGIPVEKYMKFIKPARYRKVFYLDPLDNYSVDYARVESVNERDKLAHLLWQAYSDLDFHVERVPVLAAQERVEYILHRITQDPC